VSCRVLLADDTAQLRALVRETLEGDGRYEVVAEAENGREAVALADRLKPDLVVLDLAMPVMDGLEALPLVQDAAPEATVVVLSSFEAAHVAEQVLSLGAAAYVEKDAGLVDLPNTLGELTGLDCAREASAA
jgi:DNA-binding NarL/FixJ family response regulator